MQRQSLGSPNSKIHNTHGIALLALDPKDSKLQNPLEKTPSKSNPSSSSSSSHPHHHEKEKPSKLLLSSSPSSSSKPDKLIHLIPILTFLCFFILYLFSHDPSQSDLAHFDGFKHPFKSVGEDSALSQIAAIKRTDALAIRSLKNLREMKKYGHSKYRLHRKLGEF